KLLGEEPLVQAGHAVDRGIVMKANPASLAIDLDLTPFLVLVELGTRIGQMQRKVHGVERGHWAPLVGEGAGSRQRTATPKGAAAKRARAHAGAGRARETRERLCDIGVSQDRWRQTTRELWTEVHTVVGLQ